MVSAFKGQHLKTSIREDMTLHLSIWHNGTKEAMLMHVGSRLDTIKKCGHFQVYKEAQALYMAKKVAKQAKAAMSLLDGVSKGTERPNKSSKKAKEVKAKEAEASGPEMGATFLADLKKAKEASENLGSTLICSC
jgi:hypothetical protein